MRIVAVDPGGMCGLAEYVSGANAFASWELPYLQAVQAVEATAHDWLGIDLLVVERFDISPSTLKKNMEGPMMTLDVIGGLRYVAYKERIKFEPQPQSARDVATPARLKKLGWYKPSKGGHRNSAASHLLAAALRHGVLDPKELVNA